MPKICLQHFMIFSWKTENIFPEKSIEVIIIMYFYSASIQLPAQERFYE